MNSEFVIRPATLDDAPALAELGTVTFTETFGHLYPPEDLDGFLSRVRSVEAFTRKLADAEISIWIAEPAGGAPAGFITVGPCRLPVANVEPTAGEIQQLYVLARHHNRHLGSRLMKTGIAWLEAQGRAPLYVGVWSENLGAQRFYGRYGFEKAGEYTFHVGNTRDREFIMKREALS